MVAVDEYVWKRHVLGRSHKRNVRKQEQRKIAVAKLVHPDDPLVSFNGPWKNLRVDETATSQKNESSISLDEVDYDNLNQFFDEPAI